MYEDVSSPSEWITGTYVLNNFIPSVKVRLFLDLLINALHDESTGSMDLSIGGRPIRHSADLVQSCGSFMTNGI